MRAGVARGELQIGTWVNLARNPAILSLLKAAGLDTNTRVFRRGAQVAIARCRVRELRASWILHRRASWQPQPKHRVEQPMSHWAISTAH